MDINKLMQQAKKMQQELEKEEKEFKNKFFSFEKQGISLEMNGDKKITKIDINEVLIDPEDKETLQDLIIVAINDAIEEIDQEYKKMHQKLQGKYQP